MLRMRTDLRGGALRRHPRARAVRADPLPLRARRRRLPDGRHLPRCRREARLVSAGQEDVGNRGRSAGRRIAVSEFARRAAEPYAGGPIEVIPNGILLPEHSDPGGRNGNVVFIGRNERRKGLEVLLRAWPEVKAQTQARLRVVGADPLSVRWLARRQGLSLDRVDLLGGLSEDDLSAELEAASLLAAPALGGETSGWCSRAPSRRRRPRSHPTSRAIRRLPTSRVRCSSRPATSRRCARDRGASPGRARRAALGAGAREVAEQYSWDRIAGRLVEIYEQLAVGATSERAAA